MKITKENFINQARTYLNVKFKHRGRNKKIGVDCIGLVICTLNDLGVTVEDKKVYGREPFNDGLREALNKNLGNSYDKKNMSVGDIALIQFKNLPGHVGIITKHTSNDNFCLLHCFGNIGRVVEHSIDEDWMSKIVEVYKPDFLIDTE